MMNGSLAARLRVLRAERGLTLRDVEELTGVGKDTLSNIERGLQHPHTVTLAKIAQGYDVPVEKILEVELEVHAMPRYIDPEAAKHEARRMDTAHDALEEALELIPNTPAWQKARRYVAIVSDMCAIEADTLREEKPS